MKYLSFWAVFLNCSTLWSSSILSVHAAPTTAGFCGRSNGSKVPGSPEPLLMENESNESLLSPESVSSKREIDSEFQTTVDTPPRQIYQINPNPFLEKASVEKAFAESDSLGGTTGGVLPDQNEPWKFKLGESEFECESDFPAWFLDVDESKFPEWFLENAPPVSESESESELPEWFLEENQEEESEDSEGRDPGPPFESGCANKVSKKVVTFSPCVKSEAALNEVEVPKTKLQRRRVPGELRRRRILLKNRTVTRSWKGCEDEDFINGPDIQISIDNKIEAERMRLLGV